LGLILDSSAAVAAERQGKNPKQLLQAIALETGDDELGVSALTVLEMAHGIVRADTAERREKRQRFLDELMSVVPVHPVTVPLALRAGQIDGQSQAKGIRIPLSDLLIGVTALELGYRIATHNARHFQLIPGISVIQL
jgi:predicted nucleic acid-binding protein